MARIIVPLAEGFEEIEAVTVIDLLRRAGVDVVTAGVDGQEVTGSHGITVRCDSLAGSCDPAGADGIVLPGGMPGTTHLIHSAAVGHLVREMFAAGKLTAAICAAPKVLASTGLLDGRSATSFPGAIDGARYPEVRLIEQPVVTDGTVVTSRGPGTAMDFALHLIELLLDRDRRNAVEAKLMRPV